MPVITYPKFQAPDINGVNLSGGKVYFYLTGTTTFKDTYSDEELTTTNANPVILDSRGEADIYLAGEYKVLLKDSNDVEIWSMDPIFGWLSSKLVINNQTASYTLVLTDDAKLIEMEVGSANNLTVPPNSSVAFAIGTTIVVVQKGAGTTTIVQGSGVTVNTPSTLAINAQYDAVGLVKTGTNEWLLTGGMA